MKRSIATACLTALTLVAPAAFAGAADQTPVVNMKLVPEKAVETITHSYMPRPLALKADEPAGLKKKPALENPLFGELKFGGKAFLVALDEPKGVPAKLYVDTNCNGDLTDDAPAVWAKDEKSKTPIYQGSFKLPLPGDAKEAATITMRAYRFDASDTARASLNHTILYYGDYAYAGEITFGGVAYRAVMVNDLSDGDFRGTPAASGRSGVRLMIDLNKDGKFDSKAETFDPAKPFNIKGTTWEVADLTAAGDFKLAKSAKEVAEIPMPPDLSRGHNAIAFTATRMDGTKVNFPADYKGKLVMVDFWATWCGPCMAEVPNLVKSYNTNHAKGFEILGVSLDRDNATETIKKVTGEKAMTWPQIYQGANDISDKYGIRFIPQAYLVDGTTGRILAEGDGIRGEKLEQAIKAAMEEMSKGVVQ